METVINELELRLLGYLHENAGDIFEKWRNDRKADVIKKVIADARGWEKDDAVYERVLRKLINDLKPQP